MYRGYWIMKNSTGVQKQQPIFKLNWCHLKPSPHNYPLTICQPPPTPSFFNINVNKECESETVLDKHGISNDKIRGKPFLKPTLDLRWSQIVGWGVALLVESATGMPGAMLGSSPQCNKGLSSQSPFPVPTRLHSLGGHAQSHA